MNEWMDGWRDERTCEWTNERLNGWQGWYRDSVSGYVVATRDILLNDCSLNILYEVRAN